MNSKLDSANKNALKTLLNLGNNLDYDTILSLSDMQSLNIDAITVLLFYYKNVWTLTVRNISRTFFRLVMLNIITKKNTGLCKFEEHISTTQLNLEKCRLFLSHITLQFSLDFIHWVVFDLVFRCVKVKTIRRYDIPHWNKTK